MLDDGDIDQNDVDTFFEGVLNFFVKAYNYFVAWLPLDDGFIKHSIRIDFEKRNEATFDYIETILQTFNRIHKAIVQDQSILNVVEEEFLDYQALSNHDFLCNIWESAELSDNGHRTDVTWGHLKPKLPFLSKIAESALVVPHSNASEVRVFFPSFEKIRLSSDLDSILEGHLV